MLAPRARQAAALCCACLCATARAEVVEFDFDLRDWVVDFLRPTISLVPRAAQRATPFNIPDENRKAAVLVNGKYPGPTIEVYENDTVVVHVRNNLLSEAATIHWHGIHPVDTPWTDGALGVSQAAIGPGHNFTYTFRAWPAGTHYWHSHMDAMQSAKGMRGPFIVKKRVEDVHMPHYDEERVVVMADEWRDPSVCLKLEGAMAGNDVCSDIDFASVNGQVAWGVGQKTADLSKYPYPLVDVQAGKCYRMRFIMMASNAENYIVTMAGHNMTLVSLDGVDVRPIMVTKFNLHIGERADVIVCADQAPGYYAMGMLYDYACTLTKGNFIPPGFHPVSACSFHAFLHYADQPEGKPFHYGPPDSPTGTGGGANPRAVAGVPFDLTNPPDWTKTQPIVPELTPTEPDARYTIALGLKGPLYKGADTTPMEVGRWYMDIDGRRETWRKPATPTLHTKNLCANESVPVLNIPENATWVELVLNNLSPTAHNIHMHGMLFQVVNVANFQWCNVNKTACFVMPQQINPCPAEDRGYADQNCTGCSIQDKALMDLYWGCKYNPAKDIKTQNLAAPLRKDSFQLWQRSWAVIRFRADAPGVWQFHCHMEQHIPLGMVMAINVLPSKQKPVPHDVPTEGPCPLWSDPSPLAKLQAENARLRGRIEQLEHH